MPDPNNTTNQTAPASDQTFQQPQVDTPPMPDLAGTAAPQVSFPDLTQGSDKKIYGGGKGKIIATIFGLLLLVGGIGTGVYLALNNQNPNEKAAVQSCDAYTSSNTCTGACNPKGLKCKWLSANSNCIESNIQCGTTGGGTLQACANQAAAGVNNLTWAASCTTLNAKVCQKAANGIDNTGYECTCIDLSPASCKFYANNCNTLNLANCPTANAGTSFGNCSGTNFASTNNISETTNGVSIGAGSTAHATLVQCPNQFPSGGCSSTTVIRQTGAGGSLNFDPNFCGAQQIDVFVGNNSCFVHRESRNCATTKPPVITPPPTPTPTPLVTAQCQNVTAYSPTWTVLTASQLAQKRANDVVNFCVVGSASAGSFDMAKFTINTVVQAQTTTKRPNSQDFCQSYTIPANTYTFNVTAQIHHVTLGWK